MDKPYTLTDGGGLYLHISKAGTKAWRIDYTTPITRKRVTVTLGQYPEITLAAARQMRTDIKYHLANGDDPRDIKREEQCKQLLESKNTFAMVAEEYMSRKTHIAPSTIKNNYRQLKRLNAYLGIMPITDIRPMDVLEVCRSAEAQGYIETALKMRIKVHYVLTITIISNKNIAD